MLKTASLISEARKIICEKATENPGTGEYNDLDTPGTYLCRQCGMALFRSEHKFHSGCGWPSFDTEIPGKVKREPDPDGRRTEILCYNCSAHLGHIFRGENFTQLNTRHCVNSLALDFVDNLEVAETDEAIVAGGCFWGIEYYFKKLPGVLKVEVGYSGGKTESPTYKEICTGTTGHIEVARIIFDKNILNFKDIIKYFFEIHDPTQIDGQGPDIGTQYLSTVFYYNEDQLRTVYDLIHDLEHFGYKIATRLKPVTVFWKAEDYHQNYYQVNAKSPYCHSWQNRFKSK